MLVVRAGLGSAAETEDAMTVDMLAATFFWPEGALLGSHHPDAGGDAPAPSDRPQDEAPEHEGFWAAVKRNLWRPAAEPSTASPR